MKAIKPYFPVVLFIMLLQANLNLWMKPQHVTIQLKAVEQYLSSVAVYHAPPGGSKFQVSKD